MIDWLCALADRPIAEHERRLAFALAAAIILAAAGVLVLTRTGSPPPAPRSAAPITEPRPAAPPPAAPAAPINPAGPAGAPAGATQGTRVFLGGYLAYLYGHTPAREIRGAAPRLLRKLEREHPRVSPATRQRHPRILEIIARQIAGGRVAATASIADGGVAHYAITVTLQRHRGRWQVTDVGGD